MADTLEIAILGVESKKPAVIYARCGSDVAVESLPVGEELKDLLNFRDVVDRALLANKDRPQDTALTKFGYDLFNYIIRGEVIRIYNRLPTNSLIRVSILSNDSDLQSLPWEYLQDPTQGPGPWIVRSVVRIVPTINVELPAPLPLGNINRKLKILFAYADPVDQDPVSWPSFKDAVERALSTGIPLNSYEMKTIDANPKDLAEALQADQYDIFHFCGHGEVRNGEGYVLLLNRATNESIPYSSKKLSMALRARGIRLVILSACSTAKGNFAYKFEVTAMALINSGIPAVVAYQFPVPDSTVATFIKPLYDQLLKTGDIDRAVNESRYLLANEPGLTQGTTATLEWGIPTLYRHIAGSKVFEPANPQGGPQP